MEMMPLPPLPGDSQFANLSTVIAALGTQNFSGELLRLLQPICGADSCVTYTMETDRLSLLAMAGACADRLRRGAGDKYLNGKLWKGDPPVAALRDIEDGQAILTHASMDDITSREVRSAIYEPFHIKDRIILAQRQKQEVNFISITSSQVMNRFHARDVMRLQPIAQVLIGLADRHQRIAADRLAMRLSSLDDIERRLIRVNEWLSPREIAVCARTIYGVTAEGIGADLSISRDTVTTYKKRIYSKLNVSSSRELVAWYFKKILD